MQGQTPLIRSLWYQTIGEDFVEKAFSYARKYTEEYAPDHKIKFPQKPHV